MTHFFEQDRTASLDSDFFSTCIPISSSEVAKEPPWAAGLRLADCGTPGVPFKGPLVLYGNGGRELMLVVWLSLLSCS